MIVKSHGEILRGILKEKGIKVTDLAKKINVPASSIYSILNRDGTGTRKIFWKKYLLHLTYLLRYGMDSQRYLWKIVLRK